MRRQPKTEAEGLGDTVLLRRLLDHGDLLVEREVEAFTGMLHGLEHAGRKSLSPSQREWAERAYERHDVGRYYTENLVSSGRVKADATGPKYPWELPENRPLKPPGRK